MLAAYQGPSPTTKPEPHVVCIQAPTLDEALAQLQTRLARDAYAAPVKIDIVTGVQPLQHVVPVVDAMTLRPGLDGVCELGRCLAPWQLLGQNLLIANTPIPVIPELRFGFDPIFVRKALAPPDRRGLIPLGLEGLVRIETASFVTDREGALHRLRRLREDGPELTAEGVREALRSAENYILGAQGPDGRFEYKLDPFTGLTSYPELLDAAASGDNPGCVRAGSGSRAGEESRNRGLGHDRFQGDADRRHRGHYSKASPARRPGSDRAFGDRVAVVPGPRGGPV